VPEIRFENRVGFAGNGSALFGPWQAAILVRTIQFSVIIDAALGDRIPTVEFGNVDGYWLRCVPAGQEAQLGPGEQGEVCAFPNAGVSITRDAAGVRTTGPRLVIPIPYNLIVPQRHTVRVRLLGGQVADSVAAIILCLEYSKEAYLTKGKPKAAKNNP